MIVFPPFFQSELCDILNIVPLWERQLLWYMYMEHRLTSIWTFESSYAQAFTKDVSSGLPTPWPARTPDFNHLNFSFRDIRNNLCIPELLTMLTNYGNVLSIVVNVLETCQDYSKLYYCWRGNALMPALSWNVAILSTGYNTLFILCISDVMLSHITCIDET